MQKRWILTEKKVINDEVKGLSPILLKILNQRGLNEKGEIDSFLYGTLDDLHDPFLLTDMKRAVDRITEAINSDEKIMVFGDYDVDGITSTTLLYRYFKESFDYKIDFYLPNRQKEGYGLNKDAIRDFAVNGYKLLITVDCGITAIEEVEYANSKGIDVIVTDHHQPADRIPEAVAVIDPHRSDDSYPFKYLAGVGVSFKLCQALEYMKSGKYISDRLVDLLDIVTLGTVADIVTLTGENRNLVKKGLEIINNTSNPGLKKLIKKVGLDDKEITTGRIGYIIAPHLNAAGRVSDPLSCIELLTTEDLTLADQIAEDLKRTNKERQDIERSILEEAKEMVENEIDLKEEKAIILASEKWHHGIIGIVASRLVEEYYRPTILIAIDNGVGKGSCRSINSLDLHKALSECSDCLDGFGGHKMAAGLTIDPARLPDFKSQFNKVLDNCLNREDLIPSLKIDGLLDKDEISMEFYQQLSLLEPHGMGNSRPVFVLNNIRINRAFTVGKDNKHLKFSLNNGLEGIGFGFGNKINQFKNNNINIAFYLDLNEWQGEKKIQLALKDFNLPEQSVNFPVYFKGDGCTIADKRGCQDFLGYIEQLLSLKHKVAVFINDLKIYYNILKRLDNKNVFLAEDAAGFNKFIELDNGVIFFTTSMIRKAEKELKSEEIYSNDIIFISLPFSSREMKGAINFFVSKNTENHIIHFLFSEKSLQINRQLMKRSLPSDKYLRQLYLYMRALSRSEFIYDDLKKAINNQGELYVNHGIIGKSLQIFQELGLIEINNTDIKLLSVPTEKLDLSNSISYNDNIDIITEFKNFVDLALSGDLFMLINEISKPYKEVK